MPSLPNMDRYEKVVTRFSPNPDCVLHIGSLRAIILSHEYARIYNGKFILRFEDTDPRLKRSSLEFYMAIREDLEWLGCLWDEEYIQSERLSIYYNYVFKLIELGGAYVCTCRRDEFKSRLENRLPCPCRVLARDVHLERWGYMMDGKFREGEAVVRVKTDLTHPNPAVRDWPAFRIIDTKRNPHPRVGSRHRVWPLYNFACGIDDHLMAITHIVRGKEHLTNTVRQKYLYSHFEWDYPEAIHYGRLKMMDTELSKSSIMRRVSSKKVWGFDDPRLPTIKALKRRGISASALKRLIIEIGPKPVDATISWENIYAYNRQILEPISKRYFYVENPIFLKVEGVAEEVVAAIPFHPSHPEMGERLIRIKPRSDKSTLLLISSKDLDLIENFKTFRLIGLFNATFSKREDNKVLAVYKTKEYKAAKGHKIPLIQWVDSTDNIDVKLTLPKADLSKGKGEKTFIDVKVGETVQLIRFGFARVDNIENRQVRLFYTHK